MLNAPIGVVFFVNIGVECYNPKKGLNIPNSSAINYIETNGEHDAKKLNDLLVPCAPAVSKVQALLEKGEAFDFKNYKKCQDSCLVILDQYRSLYKLYMMLSSAHLFWENPKVQSALTNVLTIKSDVLQITLDTEKKKFLSFIAETYKTVYI